VVPGLGVDFREGLLQLSLVVDNDVRRAMMGLVRRGDRRLQAGAP